MIHVITSRRDLSANQNTMAISYKSHHHLVIKKWIDERGGQPALLVSSKGKKEPIPLAVDFGEDANNLVPLSWDEFFRIFEEDMLDFQYQEETEDGTISRFFKFVVRNDDDEEEEDM